jgi:putative sterol carrier protein
VSESSIRTVAGVFEAIPVRFSQRKARRDFKATYLFLIGAERYTMLISEGKAEIISGVVVGECDLTITMDEAVFLAIVDGRLTGQRAFTEGKMKLEGNLQLAAALPLLFD